MTPLRFTSSFLSLFLTLYVSRPLFPVEAVVEFDYEAQQDDELSLTVGDIIVNIRQDDGGWWEGELGGRRGLFPDNFVRVSYHNRPFTSFFLSRLLLAS